MLEYRVSKEELVRWCRIPVDELKDHPDSKVDLRMYDTKAETFENIGNMMADEVIANNLVGKPTRWVLCSGPNEQYKTFIRRVHEEKISLKNVWAFQIDEALDWQCRHYPVLPISGSCEGRMNKIFYDMIEEELNVPVSQRFFCHLDNMDALDEMIEKLGGLDTVYAGVGFKGLIGCNEAPMSPYYHISLEDYRNSKTRIVCVNPDTMIAYSERSYGGNPDMCNPMMITLGFKSLLTARRAVYMITTGTWKQTILRIAMFSEPTTEYPVTLFQGTTPECVLFCDRVTADHTLSHDTGKAVNRYSVPGLFQ
jgi:glucosamine-6-phosphate deaminase